MEPGGITTTRFVDSRAPLVENYGNDEPEEETTEEETTSYFEYEEVVEDKKVNSYVTYRTQSAVSTIAASNASKPDPSVSGEVELRLDEGQEETEDLTEYAELAVAKIVADQRSKIESEQKSKFAQHEEYPSDEPPRISPVPIAMRSPGGTRLVKTEQYSDPPATLIIQSFKPRSSPHAQFVPLDHDDMSDISPVHLQSYGGEIVSIAPAKKKVKKGKEDMGDTIALVGDTGRSHDPESGVEEPVTIRGQDRDRKAKRRFALLVVMMVVFVLCALGYLVVFIFDYIKGGQTEKIIVIDMKNQTAAPTTSVPLDDFIGSRPTTFMDPYQPDCSFENYTQPHVIGQCICNGEIAVLTNEVRDKYYSLETLVTSMNVTTAWELPVESCDPRNQAMVWLATTYPKDRNDLIQKFVLASFFVQMAGQEWTDRNGWLEDGDTCSWSGVECDERGSVTNILLHGNNLKGTISNEVALLRNLESLSLQSNSITGTIPPEIFLMPNIKEIKLSSNSLTGSIPSEVGVASNLEVMLLDTNILDQELPTELGQASQLRILHMGFNQFLGTIPSELFQLSTLEELRLESNTRITGRLPSEMGNLGSLEVFSISNTNILSRIPTRFGRLTSLRVIEMANTQLSGTIPFEFGLFTNLMHLDMSANKFRQSIPPIFDELKSLNFLSLSDNLLTGTIPDALGDLTGLFHLSLNGNQLVGEIPKQLGFLTSLGTLTLQDNRLTGRAPREVCNLRREELIVFSTDCSDGSRGVLCPVPSCCTECYQA